MTEIGIARSNNDSEEKLGVLINLMKSSCLETHKTLLLHLKGKGVYIEVF